MKKVILSLVVIVLVSSVASAATAPERIVGYRSGNPGLFFSHTRDAANWQTGLDQTIWHGWAGLTSVHLADLNGDTIDDKVLVQNFGNQHQFIVSYSAPGDISNTNFDVLQAEWWNNAVQVPLFGDIDGDGIDDNSIYSSGADIFAGGGIDDAMIWGSWLSNGNMGLSNYTNPHSGWNAFGSYSAHQGFLGDMNGDGVDDRVLYDPLTFGVFVDLSNPLGGYGDGVTDIQTAVGGVVGDQLAISDINGDGFDDLVIVRDDSANIGLDAYTLYGWYSTAGGLGTGLPDIQALAGSPSLGDVMLFGQLDLVPEPATLVLLGAGILGLTRRKR